MFRRGFYLSELIPLLLALAMFGTAIYGLLNERVPWVARQELVTLVELKQDPDLYWLSIAIYLLGGVVLGVVSWRTLRGE